MDASARVPFRVQLEVPQATGSGEDSELVQRYLGTVRYAGAVPPTKGAWLGVEWDDPARGKHDGSHEGTPYFECLWHATAGSFVRPTMRGLQLGTSFLSALHAKYAPPAATHTPAAAAAQREHEHEQDGHEHRLFETTFGRPIEAVLKNDTVPVIARLAKLREIGLEWERVERLAPEGEDLCSEQERVALELPRVDLLNLSFSLLHSLRDAATIAGALPSLQTLMLNSNRFELLASPAPLAGFERLRSLQLNNTLISWREMRRLASSVPNLEELQLGSNRITLANDQGEQDVLGEKTEEPAWTKLRSLNLAENMITSWREVAREIGAQMKQLETLVLEANEPLRATDEGDDDDSGVFDELKSLNICRTGINSWENFDAVFKPRGRTRFPKLRDLATSGCPLFADLEEADARLLALGRLEVMHGIQLERLDYGLVSTSERREARVFLENQRAKAQEAQKKAAAPAVKGLTLKDRLIHLAVRLPPKLSSREGANGGTISILPNMAGRLLLAKLQRHVGSPLPRSRWRLIALLSPAPESGENEPLKVDMDDDSREIAFWGLRSGDAIQIVEA